MKAYSLSIFLLDINQETTWMFSYTKEIVSYINDIKEIPEGTFRINLKMISTYQWMEPRLVTKYKNDTHHIGSFRGVRNINISLVTCEDNTVIT